MSTPVLIAFADAEILAKDHRDILVFHAATGRCWRFDEPIWPTSPEPKPTNEVVRYFGTGGMDDEFEFVWMKP